jgi:hypothetical protein
MKKTWSRKSRVRLPLKFGNCVQGSGVLRPHQLCEGSDVSRWRHQQDPDVGNNTWSAAHQSALE